jgi:hypothetical protein
MNYVWLISRNLFSSRSTGIQRQTRSCTPWTLRERCGGIFTPQLATVGSLSRGQLWGNIAKRIRPSSIAIILIWRLS